MTALLVIKWWGIALLLGIAFLPVTARLFRTFDDRGWLFAKVLGLMLGGYAVWALSVCGIIPFTRIMSILVTVFFALLVWIVNLGLRMKRSAKHKPGTANMSSVDGAGGVTSADHADATAFGKQHFQGDDRPGIRPGNGSDIRPGIRHDFRPDIRLIIAEEILFLAVLIIWTWFIGFRPEVTGTEKPMDYGFMAALDRSTDMPARDIWHGTDPINYYYGGQYFAVYLAKLAFTEVKYAYNMMRALIAALVFVMPFSIVRQMLKSAGRWKTTGGLLASAAVSCVGNFHYVLYGLFGKLFRLSGYENYWFPESTRFIGHNPPTADACIHEFPSYSFVLGDLHAHMINLIFVLLFLGILAAWMLETQNVNLTNMLFHGKRQVLGEIFPPHLLILAAMTGMFKWTNYWDFIIYLTVLLFGMGIVLVHKVRDGEVFAVQMIIFCVRMLLIVSISTIAAIPFTSKFDMMVSEVAFAKNHTAFYQFAILWGLPVITFVIYMIWLFRCRKCEPGQPAFANGDRPAFTNGGRTLLANEGQPVFTDEGQPAFTNGGWTLLANEGQPAFTDGGRPSGKPARSRIPMPYYIAILFGLCALGLILIPEIVYVKDIYEEGFSRSNTMFKLTYQAFVMFGLFFGFALPEMLANRLQVNTWPENTSSEAVDTWRDNATAAREIRPVQIAAGVLTALLILTVGYLPYSVKCWFGNVLDPSGFIGLDATEFLDAEYPEDADAIRWADDNISGQPVILETWGDSYSKDCRVSAFTGIPTVQGWYVHEWLWRENVDELNERIDAVNATYSTDDTQESIAQAKDLLRKYHVSYVFVGSCEREKYPQMDPSVMCKLGTVVYETDDYGTDGTFIVRVE